eukprot:gene41546-51461_t
MIAIKKVASSACLVCASVVFYAAPAWALLPALHRLPYGHEGGLMKLVSRVAGGIRPEDELAGVVYLMDPLDPSSLYPEAQALKRQCVTHRKPLLLTVAAAIEWMAVEWANAGGPALRGDT